MIPTAGKFVTKLEMAVDKDLPLVGVCLPRPGHAGVEAAKSTRAASPGGRLSRCSRLDTVRMCEAFSFLFERRGGRKREKVLKKKLTSFFLFLQIYFKKKRPPQSRPPSTSAASR